MIITQNQPLQSQKEHITFKTRIFAYVWHLRNAARRLFIYLNAHFVYRCRRCIGKHNYSFHSKKCLISKQNLQEWKLTWLRQNSRTRVSNTDDSSIWRLLKRFILYYHFFYYRYYWYRIILNKLSSWIDSDVGYRFKWARNRARKDATYQFCEEAFDRGGWNILPIIGANFAHSLNRYHTNQRTFILKKILEEIRINEDKANSGSNCIIITYEQCLKISKRIKQGYTSLKKKMLTSNETFFHTIFA